jgi:hypothetical protein
LRREGTQLTVFTNIVHSATHAFQRNATALVIDHACMITK